MEHTQENVRHLIIDPTDHTAQLELPDPESIRIYDTTLRDGEQMPGVALSAKQKYAIAREISDLGCHVMELCFPRVSQAEEDLMRRVCEGRHKGEIREELEISLMVRATIPDVDFTVDAVERAGFAPEEVTFEIFSSSSTLHLKYKLGPMLLEREGVDPKELPGVPGEFFHRANERMVAEAVAHARERGIVNIEFGGEDASRTEVEHLIGVMKAANAVGANRYIFADTLGCLTPEATRYYCRTLSEALPEIERVSHFHDDFGLAAANCVAGVLNGFTTFATTINGIGERAGNAPLHSIVAALRFLYSLEIPGFRYDRLMHVKSVVERLTGVPVHAKEPVIGRNVFAHESGIHTHGVGISRRMYEAIPCESVGAKSRFVYGKHSGTASLIKLLETQEDAVGREVDEGFVLAVLDEIKRERALLNREADTRQMVEQYYGNLDRLGFSEEDVVALARRVAERQQIAAGQLEAKTAPLRRAVASGAAATA